MVGLLDRALRIALTENLPSEAGRAYCDDHDLTTYGTFLRSQRTSELEKNGRWDEALRMSRDILDRAATAAASQATGLGPVGAAAD